MSESTCSTCGKTWKTGRDGSHSCIVQMAATIESLRAQLERDHDSITLPNGIQMCAAMVQQLVVDNHDKGNELVKLRSQIEKAHQQLADLAEEDTAKWVRIRELEAEQLPNEQGTNRYGLDVAYFRKTINRELNRDLRNFKPDELARVLARLSRTADKAVMHEPEFKLEAHSGEAVAWVAGSHDVRALKDLSGLEYGTILFTSPPAEKVPDYLDDMDRVPASVSHGEGWSTSAAYAFGWNACRQAMLAAQEGEK